MKIRISLALAVIALIGLGTAPVYAQALDFSENFDGVADGSPVSALLPAGLFINSAIFTPDLDGNGDPIPGSDRWRIDPDAPAVPVTDTNLFNGFAAPSPNNALGDTFSPLLLTLGDPFFNFTSLNVTLDNDPFGDTALDILFLDALGATLLSVPTDQSVTPGQVISLPTLPTNVTAIVLPAGAFYDNLSLTANAAPEPGSIALFGTGILVLSGIIARRRL